MCVHISPDAFRDDLINYGYFGLIKAAERFNFPDSCRFSTYAIPVIRGIILNEIRREYKNSKRKYNIDFVSLDTIQDTYAAFYNMICCDMRTVSPEEQAEHAERTRICWASFNQLNARQKNIADMYFKQHLTMRQIGARLGISEARAWQVIKRVKQKVQKELEKHTEFFCEWIKNS